MDIVSRLKLFLEQNGIANSQFADTCKIPRPTLSQLLNGRNKKVSNEIIAKIHAAYPRLSIMWLMFGDGEMFDGEGGPKANISFSGDAAQPAEISMKSSMPDSTPQNLHGLQRTISFGSGDDYGDPSSASLPGDAQPRAKAAQGGQPGRQASVSGQNAASQASVSQGNLSQAIESMVRTMGLQNTTPAAGAAPARRIANIMVFFDDNSFETFTPNR